MPSVYLYLSRSLPPITSNLCSSCLSLLNLFGIETSLSIANCGFGPKGTSFSLNFAIRDFTNTSSRSRNEYSFLGAFKFNTITFLGPVWKWINLALNYFYFWKPMLVSALYKFIEISITRDNLESWNPVRESTIYCRRKTSTTIITHTVL